MFLQQKQCAYYCIIADVFCYNLKKTVKDVHFEIQIIIISEEEHHVKN